MKPMVQKSTTASTVAPIPTQSQTVPGSNWPATATRIPITRKTPAQPPCSRIDEPACQTATAGGSRMLTTPTAKASGSSQRDESSEMAAKGAAVAKTPTTTMMMVRAGLAFLMNFSEYRKPFL
jgi:hypothetical protein